MAQIILSKIAFTSQVDAFHPKEKTGQTDLLVQAAKWVEMSYVLEANSSAQVWVWFFRSYVPWHGIAYILSELAENPNESGYESFWNNVLTYLDSRAKLYPSATESPFWKLIQRLLETAIRAKEEQSNTHSTANNQHQVVDMLQMNLESLQHLDLVLSSSETASTSARPQLVYENPKLSEEDARSRGEMKDDWSTWAGELLDLSALTTVADDFWSE